MPSQDCHPEACAIQSCLTKNAYNESKCQQAVKNLYQCCAEMYARGAAEGKSEEETKSDSCPIKSVVDRKLKTLG